MVEEDKQAVRAVYDIVVLDTKTNEYLTGYQVLAKDHAEARLRAHCLKIILDDMLTGRYFIFSTCEAGKPESKKVYFKRLTSRAGESITILS